ncbi:MAG: DUF2080 family transposase-associated protein [archaeon]
MIKQYNVFEEVVKEVVPFGNGSIVYTPKKWVGQTVRVVLEREPFDVKERTMELLQPHLEHVKGVFLHGSIARKEQSLESDIDVLVVSGKKFKLEKTGKFDFTIIDEETLRKELKGRNPFFVYSMLREAKPILNKGLLEELKKIKLDKRNVKWLLEDSESALKVVKEFLKLEKRKKSSFGTIVYSLVLRLRGIFLVKQFLRNQNYSNKGFKEFLRKKGFERKLVEDFYEIYCAERDERKIKKNLNFKEVEQLYCVTLEELKGLQEAHKNDFKKEGSKRHKIT